MAYRLPGSLGYADADGRPVLVPPVAADRSTAPVESDGRELAALVYDASLDDDPELVEAVRAAAGIALENERLQAESEARLAELQASRERIVAAGDAERRRLERNLHDGAQQRLVALVAAAAAARRAASATTRPAEELVTTASDELAQSLAELRELARGIHPAVLDHGLAAALDSLAARSPVPDDACATRPTSPLPEPVELAAYFVASEALANVAKYAQATSAPVRVSRAGRGAVDRDRRRRRRRRRRGRRLGPARARRPRRGARRAACASSARPAPAPSSPRSCRAGRDRRRQPARPRGHRLAPDGAPGSRSWRRSASPDELLAEVDAHEPDVAIVDVRMPPTHTDEGLRAAHEIRARPPADRRS